MSTTTSSNKPVKFIGLIMVVAGLIMVVAGGVTWGLVTSQLKAESIVVAAVTPEAPGSLAGKPVAGPFTAYAQANAINHHALAGAKDRTYAQLGADSKALAAKLTAAGATKADVAKDKGIIALKDARDNTMTGSFLRASLFTSVISFGVAALVIGLGFLFGLLGFALVKVAAPVVVPAAAVKTAPAKGAAPRTAKATA
jgi:hypothetical protein